MPKVKLGSVSINDWTVDDSRHFVQSISQRSNCCRSKSASGAISHCFGRFYIPSYLHVDHTPLLGLQRPEDRAISPPIQIHNSETSMSSTVKDFVHAICNQVAHCGLLRLIPIFQPPRISYCVAEPGAKFFHQVVPVLHAS